MQNSKKQEVYSDQNRHKARNRAYSEIRHRGRFSALRTHTRVHQVLHPDQNDAVTCLFFPLFKLAIQIGVNPSTIKTPSVCTIHSQIFDPHYNGYPLLRFASASLCNPNLVLGYIKPYRLGSHALVQVPHHGLLFSQVTRGRGRGGCPRSC